MSRGSRPLHILCTGGAGYIGSHTVLKLLDSGFQVSIMDSFVTSHRKVMERLKELTGQDLPLYEVDVCDADAVRKVFDEHSFDGVIHFAGFKAVREAVEDPIRYYRNNVIGTVNILKAMEATGSSFFVFSSSVTVYSPSEDKLGEDKPLGPSNPYGWSKYMVEQILMDAAKARDTLSVSILRYFNAVGAHPSGKIGDAPTGFPNNLMPFTQQVAVGRRESLNVFGTDYSTPDGTAVRDYIHVEDLAEAHVCALQKIIELKTGVIIHNLGSGNGYSVLQMVDGFEKASGKKIATTMCPRRPGDLGSMVSNPEKANRELNWKTQRTLQDMCESFWKWVEANPHGYGDP